MISDKASYWVAIGVLALGLNANYRDGGVQWGHQLARCARAAAEQVAAQGTAYVALARIMLGKGQAGVPVELAAGGPGKEFAVTAPRVRTYARDASHVRQAEFARTQARLAAEQARLASLDEQLRRDFVRSRARRVYVRLANLPNSEIAIAGLP
jgi:hypothetical protein